MNNLLCLFSSQLYQTGCERNSLEGEELFIKYTYESAERDLRATIAKADGDVSGTIAVKFVKGLIASITMVAEPPPDSLIGLLSQKYPPRTEFPTADYSGKMVMRSIGQPENVAIVVREALMSIIDLPMQAILYTMQAIALQLRKRNIYTDRKPDISNYTKQYASEPVLAMRYLSRTPLSEKCSNLLSIILHNRRYASGCFFPSACVLTFISF